MTLPSLRHPSLPAQGENGSLTGSIVAGTFPKRQLASTLSSVVFPEQEQGLRSGFVPSELAGIKRFFGTCCVGPSLTTDFLLQAVQLDHHQFSGTMIIDGYKAILLTNDR